MPAAAKPAADRFTGAAGAGPTRSHSTIFGNRSLCPSCPSARSAIGF